MTRTNKDFIAWHIKQGRIVRIYESEGFLFPSISFTEPEITILNGRVKIKLAFIIKPKKHA